MLFASSLTDNQTKDQREFSPKNIRKTPVSDSFAFELTPGGVVRFLK